MLVVHFLIEMGDVLTNNAEKCGEKEWFNWAWHSWLRLLQMVKMEVSVAASHYKEQCSVSRWSRGMYLRRFMLLASFPIFWGLWITWYHIHFIIQGWIHLNLLYTFLLILIKSLYYSSWPIFIPKKTFVTTSAIICQICSMIKPPRSTWHETLPFSESFRRSQLTAELSTNGSAGGHGGSLWLVERRRSGGTTVPRLLITPHYDDGGIAEGALTRKDCVTDVGIHLIWQL